MNDPILYPYRDAHGRLCYTVVRHCPKQFEILDGREVRIDAFPEETVLYRLGDLIKSLVGALVFVCEGEKDADRLASLGLLATTNPGGCRLGWRDEYSVYLAKRRVVILADNDRPGVRHAEAVAAAVGPLALSAVILKLPRLRPAEDVSDWLDFRRGTLSELLELAHAAVYRWPVPPPEPKGGHGKRHAIFEARQLSTAQKLVLLYLQHGSASAGRLSAAAIGAATGMHRVSAQRCLSALCRQGIVVKRGNGRHEVAYDRIA